MSFECQVILFFFFFAVRTGVWMKPRNSSKKNEERVPKMNIQAKIEFILFFYAFFFIWGTGNSFERKFLLMLCFTKWTAKNNNNNCIFRSERKAEDKEKKKQRLSSKQNQLCFSLSGRYWRETFFFFGYEGFFDFFIRVFFFSCPRNSILKNHQQKKQYPLANK